MKKRIEVITPTFPWYRICNINLLGGGGGKDRSSSNSPIDFVPDAITRRPIKSASIKTPTTKLTPPHTIKKEIEKPRKQPGRGRPPSKVNKFMQDSNVKNAFEVFHKDQVNSHKNNHSVRQSIVSKTQIDDAWEKASEVSFSSWIAQRYRTIFLSGLEKTISWCG